MRGVAMLAVLLLAGCVQPEATPPTTPTEVSFGPEGPAPTLRADAPTHPVGRAWTYEGIQQYNPETTFTVVVAHANGKGYLFAGAEEKDIVYEALWRNPLYGQRDVDMDRPELQRKLLSFPISEGRSWNYAPDLRVTARAAEIETPHGSDKGFRIHGQNDRVAVAWDYSPALGQIVRYSRVGADGFVYDELRMTQVSEGRSSVWYELGELMVVAGPESPAAFEVPTGFDAVIASAGGTEGARASVQAPGGPSWSTEFRGEESWQHGLLPGTPGPWVASVASRPGAPLDEVDAPWPMGWGYMHVAPVKWIRSDP